MEAFKSYIPNSLKAGYYNMVAGNGENSLLSNNKLFGRTSQAHDELGDITRFTTSMFSSKRTRAEQKAMLDKALAVKQEKYKEWQKGLEYNLKDKESYNKVDRWFQQRADKAGTDIFDKNTWLYGMPGLVAGSTSGISKMLPAALTGIATAIATGGAGGAAWLASAIGGGATFGLNYGAGVSENNAEVAIAYSERIKDYLQSQKGTKGSLYDDVVAEGRRKLGLSRSAADDDQIFDHFRKGDYTVNNSAANKKMRELAVGIESQFQDDMAATTWSAGLETALQIIPFGAALKLPGRALRYQVLKSAAGRKALRNGAVETLAKGYEIGAAASPIAGMLYAPVHYMMTPARNKVGKAVAGILDDFAKTSHMVDQVPSKLLRKHFASSTRNKYFRDIAGRWALASAAEGIEEGKQHISSERYKNGYYTDAKIKSIGETILDDFIAGSKSAGLLLGMPFEGVMSEKDREVLKEIKGGFILGGLQTAIVNTAQSIAPFVSEQKATSAIVNNVLKDKAAKVDRLNKARIYAEAAKSQSSYQNILNGFDRLRQTNKDEYDASGEYGIAPELIDDEENAFKRIAQMSIDPYTIKQAKSQGISTTGKDYNNFVAAKVLVTDELNEAREVSDLARKNLSEAVQNATKPFLDNTVKQMAAAMPGAKESSDENIVPEFSNADNFNQLNNVAQYVALLKIKDQLELGIINAQSGSHRKTESILNKQLTQVNDRINNLKPVINKYANEDETVDINNIESVEVKLALHKDMHDNLVEAYRQSFMADMDLDLAMQNYSRVVGDAYIGDKKIEDTDNIDWSKEFDNITFKDGHAADVFKEIQDTIDDDNDLSSVIDEDFDDRTDDNGEEVITPERAEAEEQKVPVNDPEKEFIDDIESETPEVVKPVQPEPTPVPETPVEPI